MSHTPFSFPAPKCAVILFVGVMEKPHIYHAKDS
jgi:hypothetical protein